MKEKHLYSKNEEEIIERQFINYFLQSVYYAYVDYFRKENIKYNRIKETLTDNIDVEYSEQLNNEFTDADNLIQNLCDNIDINFIDNDNLFKILSKFSELDVKVLNLLVINYNT